MNYEQLIAALHGAAWALSNGDGGAELHRVIHALEAEHRAQAEDGVQVTPAGSVFHPWEGQTEAERLTEATELTRLAVDLPAQPEPDAPAPESDTPADLPASELDAAE